MDGELLIELNRALTARCLSIAVAESLTCGRLQTALGAVGGSSVFFRGGLTAYALDCKIRLLGVDPVHAASVNAVSARVAAEMAAGAATLFASDLGLATTGYAEPWPSFGIVEPMAFFALCRRRQGTMQAVAGQRVDGAGLDRQAMQQRVSEIALRGLLDYLNHHE